MKTHPTYWTRYPVWRNCSQVVHIIRRTRQLLEARATRASRGLVCIPLTQHIYHQSRHFSTNPCRFFHLDAHLDEFRAVFETNRATVDDDGQRLINFVRYVKFNSRMQDLLQYQVPNWKHEPSAISSLAYLEGQLRAVNMDSRAITQLNDRSRAVAAEEKRSHDQRQPEMIRLGFRI